MDNTGRISLTDPAASQQDAGVVCRVCQKQWSKYACPRCNVRYCSLACYKAHSNRCTEGFYRENAEDQLRQTKADPEDRRKMLQTLKRMQEAEQEEGGEGGEDEEGSDMEEDEGIQISEETLLRLREKGNDLSLEDLLPSERSALQKSAASGALSRFIPAWEPWYLSPEAKRIRISPTGTRPVREVSARGRGTGDSAKTAAEEAFEKLVGESTRRALSQTDGENGHRCSSVSESASTQGEPSQGCLRRRPVEGSRADVSSEGVDPDDDVTDGPPIPPPTEEDLPPLSSLTKSPPSPLLGCHVTSVLYAYCYVMRLFNGNWRADPADAAETLGAVTPVLSDGATPSSIDDALYGCLERACSRSLAGPAGSSFGRALLDDVNGLLLLGRPGVVCALADVQRLFKAAEEDRTESSGKEAGNSSRHRAGTGSDRSGLGSLADSARSKMVNRNEGKVPSAQAEVAADRTRLLGDLARGKPGLKKSRSKVRRRTNNPELVRRKVFFFLVWANEQPDGTLRMLAAAVAEHIEQGKSRYETERQFDASGRTGSMKPGGIQEVS